MSLNNQSNRLASWGGGRRRWPPSRKPSPSTATWPEARPDAFLPDLAMSLNNQSNRLGDLGRREEALAAIEEAVNIRRDLARGPARRVPARPRHVAEQPVHPAGDLGRREEALAAIEEAVTIRRDLARARPDAFLPDLANVAEQPVRPAGALGRREEALAAIEEAVTIRRDLARARPELFGSALSGSLDHLAGLLSSLGRNTEAQAARGKPRPPGRRCDCERPPSPIPIGGDPEEKLEYIPHAQTRMWLRGKYAPKRWPTQAVGAGQRRLERRS